MILKQQVMIPALFGPSIVLFLVTSVAGCDGGLSLALFVIAGTLRGFSEAGYMSAPVDMAPDYAGTILGITVCFSQTTGFLVPWITGLFIRNEVSAVSFRVETKQSFQSKNVIFECGSPT